MVDGETGMKEKTKTNITLQRNRGWEKPVPFLLLENIFMETALSMEHVG